MITCDRCLTDLILIGEEHFCMVCSIRKMKADPKLAFSSEPLPENINSIFYKMLLFIEEVSQGECDIEDHSNCRACRAFNLWELYGKLND